MAASGKAVYRCSFSCLLLVYRIQPPMGYDGLENTPSAAILWAIYTDMHGFASRGALVESGQLGSVFMSVLSMS